MYTKYLALGAALLSLASAAPVTKRGCEPGTFNCFDGNSFAQCISDGTWSVTMSVAPGTSCQQGISANPFSPSGSTSTPPPPPANNPPTTTPSDNSPPPPPPQAPVTTIPSGSNTGNGKYPPISSWQSWESMKSKYANIIGQSCAAQGWGANNSPSETQQIFSAIESLHGSLDPRFLLAITIQESSGCVRVWTTNNGVRNPGLLQDNNGPHTCNEGGNVQNPCPADQINGMIADGVSGGSNNLAGNLAWASAQGFGDSFAYAVAARKYNSGSVNLASLDDGAGSTNSYVSDVMQRLVGAKI